MARKKRETGGWGVEGAGREDKGRRVVCRSFNRPLVAVVALLCRKRSSAPIVCPAASFHLAAGCWRHHKPPHTAISDHHKLILHHIYHKLIYHHRHNYRHHRHHHYSLTPAFIIVSPNAIKPKPNLLLGTEVNRRCKPYQSRWEF